MWNVEEAIFLFVGITSIIGHLLKSKFVMVAAGFIAWFFVWYYCSTRASSTNRVLFYILGGGYSAMQAAFGFLMIAGKGV